MHRRKYKNDDNAWFKERIVNNRQLALINLFNRMMKFKAF